MGAAQQRVQVAVRKLLATGTAQDETQAPAVATQGLRAAINDMAYECAEVH